jgi:ketosteroid isomerase-like protein
VKRALSFGGYAGLGPQRYAFFGLGASHSQAITLHHKRSSLSPRLLTVFGVIAFLCCRPSDQVGIAERAQSEAGVQASLTQWVRAVNNRSLDTLATLYLQSRDLLIVWPDGDRTLGWPQASSKWGSWDTGPAQLSYVAENPAIDILDHHVALATFRASISRLTGGGSATTSGRVMQVWLRDLNGRWKIRAEQTAVVN